LKRSTDEEEDCNVDLEEADELLSDKAGLQSSNPPIDAQSDLRKQKDLQYSFSVNER